MLWLAAHMWMLLLAAFAIGVGVGWWIWGGRAPAAAAIGKDEPMGTLDSDLEVAPENENAWDATDPDVDNKGDTKG